jgi:hypothetical protein
MRKLRLIRELFPQGDEVVETELRNIIDEADVDFHDLLIARVLVDNVDYRDHVVAATGQDKEKALQRLNGSKVMVKLFMQDETLTFSVLSVEEGKATPNEPMNRNRKNL